MLRAQHRIRTPCRPHPVRQTVRASPFKDTPRGRPGEPSVPRTGRTERERRGKGEGGPQSCPRTARADHRPQTTEFEARSRRRQSQRSQKHKHQKSEQNSQNSLAEIEAAVGPPTKPHAELNCNLHRNMETHRLALRRELRFKCNGAVGSVRFVARRGPGPVRECTVSLGLET